MHRTDRSARGRVPDRALSVDGTRLMRDFAGRGQMLPARLSKAVEAARTYYQAAAGVLVGSVGRGDSGPRSDVDVLLLTTVQRSAVPISKTIAAMRPNRHLSLILYSPTEFRRFWKEGSLFVYHVLTEGRVLWDDGYFRSLARTPFQLKKDFKEDIERQLGRLHTLRKPELFGDRFLSAYAHLFPIYKNLVFFDLARHGQPEFDKQRAFRAFFQIHPRVSSLRRRLSALQSYYLEDTRDIRIPGRRGHGSASRLLDYVTSIEQIGREVLH